MSGKFRFFITAFFVLGGSSLPCAAAELNMYDQNGNYSYGNVSPSGSVTMHDQNGNYTYGHIQ